jgi:hypothetical protein
MSNWNDHPDDDELDEYFLNRLPGHRQAEIERHLKQCPVCRHNLSLTATLVDTLTLAADDPTVIGDGEPPDTIS